MRHRDTILFFFFYFSRILVGPLVPVWPKMTRILRKPPRRLTVDECALIDLFDDRTLAEYGNVPLCTAKIMAEEASKKSGSASTANHRSLSEQMEGYNGGGFTQPANGQAVLCHHR